ncbi:MAG: M48 family metalloprotease [Bacteroidota bacterium]
MTVKWITNGLVVLCFLFGNACSKNPVTGKQQAFLMSEEKEIAIGKQNDPSIVASFGLYKDTRIQSFIDQKGQQMARISHRPELPFEFKVLDSPVVNAFALPGGFVYFTRGILAHFNNEAEFAGVLGHEIGHVTARHGAQQQRNQIVAQVGLVAGLVLSKEFANFAQQAQQGMQLLLLKNSRDHESQSDELGVLYSTKVGYDSHEMADFFSTLKRLSGDSGAAIPTFLSTHPDPANRYERVHELSKRAQKQFGKRRGSLKVNRTPYLRMIDGLTYGEDPKQGFVENNTFYHPELKFEYPVPNGWQLQNSPQQVQIGSGDGKAAIIFTIAQGNSLEQVANQLAQDAQLQVSNKDRRQINGFQALTMDAIQTNPQTGQTLQITSTFIQDGSRIFVFHGLAAQQDFGRYRSAFANTSRGYRRLSDPSKLNMQPERIKVITVQQEGTLANVLGREGIPSSRFEEFAILNGMNVGDRVARGSMIKSVTR